MGPHANLSGAPALSGWLHPICFTTPYFIGKRNTDWATGARQVGSITRAESLSIKPMHNVGIIVGAGCFLIKISEQIQYVDKLLGGGGEIRTHERLPVAGFQDRCNRPLCHTSELTEHSTPTCNFSGHHVVLRVYPVTCVTSFIRSLLRSLHPCNEISTPFPRQDN